MKIKNKKRNRLYVNTWNVLLCWEINNHFMILWDLKCDYRVVNFKMWNDFKFEIIIFLLVNKYFKKWKHYYRECHLAN